MSAKQTWFIRIVVIAAASVGFFSITGSVVSAFDSTTRPQIDGGESPGLLQLVSETDYCGAGVVDVPDQGTFFDFADACAAHDECYTAGGSETDRYSCDQAFLAEMIASCNEMWPITNWWDRSQLRNRGICYAVGRLYYAAVRVGGGTYFNYSTPV